MVAQVVDEIMLSIAKPTSQVLFSSFSRKMHPSYQALILVSFCPHPGPHPSGRSTPIGEAPRAAALRLARAAMEPDAASRPSAKHP